MALIVGIENIINTNKPTKKNLRYLISDNNGKILKNSFYLNSLINNTNWKRL